MKHFNKKGQEFTSSITKKREENTMDEYQSIGCMTSIWERAISILAGNLNSGRSYLITAVTQTQTENLIPRAGQQLDRHLKNFE